jgi:hypothetical protein
VLYVWVLCYNNKSKVQYLFISVGLSTVYCCPPNSACSHEPNVLFQIPGGSRKYWVLLIHHFLICKIIYSIKKTSFNCLWLCEMQINAHPVKHARVLYLGAKNWVKFLPQPIAFHHLWFMSFFHFWQGTRLNIRH